MILPSMESVNLSIFLIQLSVQWFNNLDGLASFFSVQEYTNLTKQQTDINNASPNNLIRV